jgi:hypothetical protein
MGLASGRVNGCTAAEGFRTGARTLTGQGKAKLKMSLPAAMATNCFALTA